MADLTNFAITPGQVANLNVPTQEITGQLVEGTNILADFTGDNVIRFPAVLSTLPQDHYNYIMTLLANTLVYMRAGLWEQQ